MTNPWPWVALHWMKVAILAVVAFLIFTKVQSCRDSKDSAAVAVAKQNVKADVPIIVHDTVALQAMARQLDATNALVVDLVARYRNPPPPVIRGTPHDSITQLAKQVQGCRDTLVATVVQMKSSCQLYRDSAKKSIADLTLARDHLTTLVQLGSPEKRVQPYVDPLYDIVNRRPVFRVGTTVKTLGPVDARVEGEYAIPSAVKTNSGDGFRLLAGAHIRF
jgi:hypothetical protein